MGGFGFILFIAAIVGLIKFAQYVFKPMNPNDDEFSKPERAEELRRYLREQLSQLDETPKPANRPLPTVKLKPVEPIRRRAEAMAERKPEPVVETAPAFTQSVVELPASSPSPMFSPELSPVFSPALSPTPASASVTSATSEGQTFDALALQEKMNAAGILLFNDGQELAVPGMATPGRVVQLKNFKKMAIVPEAAPKEWIRSISSSYDYVLLANSSDQVVLRSFNSFLQDFLFR